jgi:hypothetical protein
MKEIFPAKRKFSHLPRKSTALPQTPTISNHPRPCCKNPADYRKKQLGRGRGRVFWKEAVQATNKIHV